MIIERRSIISVNVLFERTRLLNYCEIFYLMILTVSFYFSQNMLLYYTKNACLKNQRAEESVMVCQ